MVPSPAARFSFDFADLRPAPPELRVVSGRPALPSAAVTVAAGRRPRWLPRLLPVFAAGRPLHVEVAGSGTFADLLSDSLVSLLASAGAAARLRVVVVDGGFIVGGPVLDELPPRPDLSLLPADLTRRSVAAAQELGRRRPSALLVLNGDLPRLDRHLGIEPGPAVVRVPLVGRHELEAVRRGLAPSLTRRRFGLGCLAVARTLVSAYAAGLE